MWRKQTEPGLRQNTTHKRELLLQLHFIQSLYDAVGATFTSSSVCVSCVLSLCSWRMMRRIQSQKPQKHYFYILWKVSPRNNFVSNCLCLVPLFFLCNFLSLVYFPKTADIFLLLVSNFHIQRGSLNTHIGVSHFVFKLVNVSLNFAHGAQESPASYS